MQIINLYPGSFASNCYLLLSQGEAAVVDPSANAKTILEALEHHQATLKHILLTHGHFDHILSLEGLCDATGLSACIHEEDAELPADAHKNAFYTFFQTERSFQTPQIKCKDGDTLLLGVHTIRVVHTPGHTRGSVCYLCDEELLITGDTLFDGGYGRYDLYGGDGEILFQSLKRLRSLNPSLPIYPGHGSTTTLGDALDQLNL